jgi:hypothetical protein
MPLFLPGTGNNPRDIEVGDLNSACLRVDQMSEDPFSSESNFLNILLEARSHIWNASYRDSKTNTAYLLNLQPQILWLPLEAYQYFTAEISSKVEESSWIGAAIKLIPELKLILPKDNLKGVAILLDLNACDSFIFNDPASWGYDANPGEQPTYCIPEGMVFIVNSWDPPLFNEPSVDEEDLVS